MQNIRGSETPREHNQDFEENGQLSLKHRGGVWALILQDDHI